MLTAVPERLHTEEQICGSQNFTQWVRFLNKVVRCEGLHGLTGGHVQQRSWVYQ